MSQLNDADVYDSFLAFHEAQLIQSGVPEHFYQSVCNKLNNQIFDAGEFIKTVQSLLVYSGLFIRWFISFQYSLFRFI